MASRRGGTQGFRIVGHFGIHGAGALHRVADVWVEGRLLRQRQRGVGRQPGTHAVTVHQQQAVIGLQRRAQGLRHPAAGAVTAVGLGLGVQPAGQAQQRANIDAAAVDIAPQPTRQRHPLGLALRDVLAHIVGQLGRAFQPPGQRPGHRHGVGGDDKAIDIDAKLGLQPGREQAGPQALEHGRRAQVLTGLDAEPAGVDGPQRVGLAAVGVAKLLAVGGDPFGLTGERTAPAALGGLLKRPYRLGSGQHTLQQIVQRRVQRDGFGPPDLAPAQRQAAAQQFPAVATQVARGRFGKKGLHGGGKLGAAGIDMALAIGSHQRKRHCRPVHLRKTL